MGAGLGALKYMFFVIITPVGFACMYVFGGGIMSVFQAIPHIISGDFIQAAIAYFFAEALPPTSLGQILGQSIVGTFVAGIKWFFAMIIRGTPF